MRVQVLIITALHALAEAQTTTSTATSSSTTTPTTTTSTTTRPSSTTTTATSTTTTPTTIITPTTTTTTTTARPTTPTTTSTTTTTTPTTTTSTTPRPTTTTTTTTTTTRPTTASTTTTTTPSTTTSTTSRPTTPSTTTTTVSTTAPTTTRPTTVSSTSTVTVTTIKKDVNPAGAQLWNINFYYNFAHGVHAFCADLGCVDEIQRNGIGYDMNFGKGHLGRAVSESSIAAVRAACPTGSQNLRNLGFTKSGKKYIHNFAGSGLRQGWVAIVNGSCGATIPIKAYKSRFTDDMMYARDLEWNTWYQGMAQDGVQFYLWP